MIKKIGILGGTFDPIHIGHYEMAEYALKKCNLDEIWFMPSYNPPHKNIINYSSFVDRINMIKLQINNNKLFKITEIEKNLYDNNILKITSTNNVLKYIKNEYNNYCFYFILGYDSIKSIATWVDYEDFLLSNNLILFNRNNDYDKKYIEELKNKYSSKICFMNDLITNISSNEIRNKIINNENVDKYLNKNVIQYILEHNLYKKE